MSWRLIASDFAQKRVVEEAKKKEKEKETANLNITCVALWCVCAVFYSRGIPHTSFDNFKQRVHKTVT